MKSLLSVLFFFYLSSALAQDAYLFQPIYNEDSKYLIESFTSLDTGAEEGMENTGWNPPEISMSKNIKGEILTDKKSNQGHVPFKKRYTQYKTISSLSGESDSLEWPYNEMVVYGQFINGFEIALDSIAAIDEDLVVFKHYYKNESKNDLVVGFPLQMLTIGDTFKENKVDNKFSSEYIYTFESVENGLAYFSFKGMISNSYDEKSISSASGKLEGTFSYNLSHHFVSNYKIRTNLVLDSFINDKVVTTNFGSSSETIITLVDK